MRQRVINRVAILILLALGALACTATITPAQEPVEDDGAKPRILQRTSLAASRATRSAAPLELPFEQRLRITLLTIFGLVWFFWLGAALGSYLNVVVYRLPLGMASVAPDSRCPQCQSPIRWYDNIPVVSWLRLRGRCRQCQLPIAPRYILVELLVGTLFVSLLAIEVLSGGTNLPVRPARQFASLPMIEHFTEWDLVAIYLFHAALVWFLTAVVLFRHDRHVVPKDFLNWALLIGILAPTIWPWLRPDTLVNGMPSHWSAFWTGVLGQLLSLLMLGFVVPSAKSCVGRVDARGTIVGLVADCMPPLLLVGAFLGSSALTSVVCWSLVVIIARRHYTLIFPRAAAGPLALVVLIALLLHLTFWNLMTGCPWWPGPETSFWHSLAMLVFLTTLCGLLGRYLPPDFHAQEIPPTTDSTIIIDVESSGPHPPSSEPRALP
jgi:leader peptidase (prepilin peptidase)/N-methyltransferase